MGGGRSGENKEKRSSRKCYDPSVQFSKIPGLAQTKSVYKFFKMTLKLWEFDLDARDEPAKRSTKGREETKLVKQVVYSPTFSPVYIKLNSIILIISYIIVQGSYSSTL